MKLGIITLDEPFGLYILEMAKADSERNVNRYHDKWLEKRGHSMNAMALISLLMLVAWTALSTYATAT